MKWNAQTRHSRHVVDQSPAFCRSILFFGAFFCALVSAAWADSVPELLHYKFNGTGTSVPNLASTPPPGAATATIKGALTQTGPDLNTSADGASLVGSGISSETDFLDTGWGTDLSGMPWTISFVTSNIAPSATVFHIFGDATAGGFRCFTNGSAGAGNWVLRGIFTDVQITGGATMERHRTTFVYDPTAQNIKGYLDGVLVTTVIQLGPIITGAGPLKVMGYDTEVGAPAGGLLDDFRVYNRALTAAQVLDIDSMPNVVVEFPAGNPLPPDTGAYAFTDTPVGTGNPVAFTVRNTGTKPLNNLSVTIDGAAPAKFSLSTPLSATTLAPGENATFTITFQSTLHGTFSADLHVLSNDPDHPSYDLSLSATALGSAIVVEQPENNALSDGGSTVAFGDTEIVTGASVRTFTVRNVGNADLTNLDVSIDGGVGAEFSLSSSLATTTLAPNESATFQLTFTPPATTDYSANLHVLSNDFNEASFDVALTGTGIDTTAPQASVAPFFDLVAGPIGTAVLGDLIPDVTRSDASGTTMVTQTPPSGTVLRLGSYPVSFKVEDPSGNFVTVPTTVRVAFAPVAMPELTSYVKAGPVLPTGAVGELAPSTPGLPTDASFGALFTPAISDARQMAARATLLSGKLKLAAIYVENGDDSGAIVAFQNSFPPDAAGVALPEVTYKSFSDPVISPAEAIAFAGKMQGRGAKVGDDGLWSDVFTAPLDFRLILRENSAVPGLGSAKLKAVNSVVALDDALLVLVSLKGAPGVVSPQDDSALLRITGLNTALPLLREGQVLNGFSNSIIKSFTVLTPALGSPGHGRWNSADTVVAKVTLMTKEILLVSIAADGTVTKLLSTNDTSTPVGGLTRWKSFALPAVASDGTFFATAATLQLLLNTVTAKDDTLIATSPDGVVWSILARESAPISTALDAPKFVTFFDPVVNTDGRTAFLATLQGTGVTPANKTALFVGDTTALNIAARLGTVVPDETGTDTTAVWSKFISHALPNDTGVVFLAETKGGDTNTKNKLGLWAADASGQLRRLLRAGTPAVPGGPTLTSFTLLTAVPGAYGAARSYNASHSIAVLATFVDKTQSILRIDLP